MEIKVRIPSPLQPLTGDQGQVCAQGTNLKEVLENLEVQFPGIKSRLYDEEGALRKFVNLYVNDQDVRFLGGEETLISDGDEVSIVPAIAGGKH